MKKINFEKIKSLKPKKIKFKKEKKIQEDLDLNKETKKVKTKRRKIRIGYYFLILLTFMAICILIGMAGFFFYIYKSAPEFDPAQLYNKEASLIYDSEGNLIATLGREKRENVSYDELPQVFVDALVATEDARFFQHNGFDLPRFVKASIGQVLGNSGAGGASTLTMQVSKNAFTSLEASGIEGIIRKFTDIYMSIFKIEKNYTKEEILEFYANYAYLGSGAYGVEQASRTYFGKNVSNLSLTEAALIAGLFQAPGGYDPYIYPDAAEGRRNQVLNLMVRHGYLDQETADTAKKIHVKDLLVAEGYSTINKYQGFINTVVKAVEEDTGSNAYDTPMIIHSTMVASKQDVINKFYSGELGYKFKDDLIQVGIALLDNKSGAIIAVGTGRNTKELTFNYATMTNAHPGSTAKPIFEYGPGIEYNKWSTYTPFFDEKDAIKYSTGAVINNWNNSYEGLLTLKKCLAKSKNTCALQAFQQVDNATIYDFVTSIGIKPETSSPSSKFINEAHAVGGFTGVNPVQLAGAYEVFATGGYYTKPYSYTKVEFIETGEVVEPDITKKKVLSPQTAYMITNILYAVTPSTVYGMNSNIATKTGTSSYDNSILRKYGLTSSIIRDSWVATYSPDYTMTFWYGYDALDDEHYACKCYNTMSSSSSNRNQIQGLLVRNMFEKNSKFKSPGGISTVEVELGTIPAQRASEFTPADIREKHMFISGSEPTETSSRYAKLTPPSNLSVIESGNVAHVSWTSPGLPSAVDSAYLENYFNSGYGKFAAKYYQERLEYNKVVIGDFGFEVYLAKGSNTKYVGWTANTNYDIDLSLYSGSWDTVLVKSVYSIFKANASDTVSVYLGAHEDPVTINIKINDVTITKDSSWKGSGPDAITSLKVNGETITDYTATLAISSIKDSDGNEIAIDNMRKKEGNYKVTYQVTFEYNISEDKKKKYTQPATQNVTVTAPVVNESE